MLNSLNHSVWEMRCGVVWCGVVWNGMEWNGMEWNGMEWNGMAWHGTAWHGVACRYESGSSIKNAEIITLPHPDMLSGLIIIFT